MGYALLWIESLAAALVGTAAVLSLSARCERKLWRRLLPTLAALVPLGLGVAAAVFARVLEANQMGAGWFVYAASWTAAFAIGAGVMARAGLSSIGQPEDPAARAWPSARLATAFAAILVLQIMTLTNLDAAVRIQLAGLRSEAGALALSVAPPRVPDASNAALVYERAFEALERLHPSGPPLTEERIREIAAGGARPAANPPPVSERFETWMNGKGEAPAQDDPELLDTQQRLAPVLALVRRAAAMPECVFDHDYAQPRMDWLLPELANLRRVTRLLGFEARACALQGRMKEAIENLRTIRDVARHMRADSPLLIGWICASSVERVFVNTLEKVLASGTASRADISPLVAAEPASYARSLLRALRMEEAFGLSAMAMLAEGDDPSGTAEAALGIDRFGQTLLLPLWRVFLLGDDVRSYRQVMVRCRDIGVKPYYESAADWKSLTDWAVARQSGILTRLLTPTLSSSAENGAITDARERLARVAIAAELHRAETGAWPAKLDDVAPARMWELPLDPFDGQPLRMRAVEGGLVLYSVGPNRVDDGGVSNSPDEHQGDLVFRLGKAPR